MRIIAGEFRGRKLLDPADQATRPVTDRVKQSVFDVLRDRLPGGTVLDLFAGTGSFGLESLSRGAARVAFFEQHRPAVDRLRRNIATLGVGTQSRVVTADLFRVFAEARGTDKADVIFLDPPYRYLNERPDELRTLIAALASRHLAGEGRIVLRHDAKDELDLAGVAVAEADRRKWGSMTVRFLRAAGV